jgi:hypothetical protein
MPFYKGDCTLTTSIVGERHASPNLIVSIFDPFEPPSGGFLSLAIGFEPMASSTGVAPSAARLSLRNGLFALRVSRGGISADELEYRASFLNPRRINPILY